MKTSTKKSLTRLIYWLVTVLNVWSLQSCAQEQAIKPELLRVELAVRNVNIQSTTGPNSLSNPIFSLSIKNGTNKQLLIKKDFLINPSLFQVSRYTAESKTYDVIGSAINVVALTQELALVLEPDKEVIYEVPWAIVDGKNFSGILGINPANKLLPPGKYRTSFQLQFEVSTSSEEVPQKILKQLSQEWETN
jgi:hypothetical protein